MPFTVTMPKLSPTMEEGTCAKWHKKEGDFVKAGELLLEIATDKATIELNALDEGWLRKILVPEGKAAVLNEPIALFTATKDESIADFKAEKPKAKEVEKEVVAAPKETPAAKPEGKGLSEPSFSPLPPLEGYKFEYPRQREEKRMAASPLAKKLSAEQGLDLGSVAGTGPGGRITSKDLLKAQKAAEVTPSDRSIPQIAPGTYEEIPLSPMRKTIAKRLQQSKTFIPHFYVKQVVDASPLVSVRDQLKNIGLKVTFNDLIVRASALALRKHPGVNAGFNNEAQTIVHYKTIDVSVAVTVEAGLITPILRHTDYKSVAEISVEIRELAERAKQGKLKPEEYQGGSFCVSNLGMYGITEFTAVINPPQGAILAVGGIVDQPVCKEGTVVAGKTLSLTLSADHRVIDGSLAAQFMKTLQHYLENPAALLL